MSTETGQFISLQHGPVYFETAGPSDADVQVVLIHGIASGGFIWDRNFHALAAQGHNVIRLDLYGRGRSAKPRIRYDLTLFVEQVHQFLVETGCTRPIHLVGLSMGGAVATGFAHLHPSWVDKLVLIAPAGGPTPIPVPMRLIRRRGMGELIYRLLGKTALTYGARKSLRTPDEFPEFFAQLTAQFASEDYFHSVLSSCRHMPLFDLEDSFRAIGSQKREIALIWGDRDEIVPYQAHEDLLEWMPNATLTTIAGGGHACNLEDSETVNGIIDGFLRS